MQEPYFEMTVPLLIKNISNLKAILMKGAEHAHTSGMTEADFLGQNIASDMFPLLKQIQIATDNAKAIPARLCGIDPISLPDTETTVVELKARMDTVLAHLATYTPEQFAHAGERKVMMPYYPNQFILGKDYLVEFALPNFFFHETVAYAIIRMIGTTLGKGDYLGSLSMQPISK